MTGLVELSLREVHADLNSEVKNQGPGLLARVAGTAKRGVRRADLSRSVWDLVGLAVDRGLDCPGVHRRSQGRTGLCVWRSYAACTPIGEGMSRRRRDVIQREL